MKHIHHILYSLLLIAGLNSCTTDSILEESNGGESVDRNAQVMLSLSIPATQLPAATRTLVDDAAVTSLYLLVFEDGALTAKTDITSKFLNANNGMFYVAVKETEKRVQMSIVANTTIISDIGATRAETLKSLTFDNPSALSAMPMYGEVAETFEGLSRDKIYDVKVKLVRALAKIEVQYNSTQTAEEFQFLDIEVLNTNAKGYIATGQGEMTANSILESSPISPTYINGQTVASAYVAETKNNSPNKISVLIHGRYDGADGYYRLDMIPANQDTEITGLLRNCKYVFALQNVNYPGSTREEALTGDPDNRAFEARLMTLSAEEAEILDITTDDEFFLGVNSATMQLIQNDNGLCFAKLKILTNNYTEGWRIVDAPEGVTFNPGTTGGTATSDKERKVSSIWVYDTRVVKTDFSFYITSGKIRKAIMVNLPEP